MIVTLIIVAVLVLLSAICLPIILKAGQRYDELLKDKLDKSHNQPDA